MLKLSLCSVETNDIPIERAKSDTKEHKESFLLVNVKLSSEF